MINAAGVVTKSRDLLRCEGGGVFGKKENWMGDVSFLVGVNG